MVERPPGFRNQAGGTGSNPVIVLARVFVSTFHKNVGGLFPRP